MAKGKRYDSEPKLNKKKVFGSILALLVIVLIIISILKILNTETNNNLEKKQYFPAYNNGKWGVIDNLGNTVIDFKNEEMVVVPNKEKAVFICTYDIDDNTGEYKTKVINEKNQTILKDYERVEAIDNYDSKQNIWFEDDVLKFVKDGKYGIINFKGEIILKAEYDSITSLKGVTENLLVTKEGKVGLVNTKGQTIIETKYSKILTLKEGYKSEYIVIDESGKYGVVSTSGATVLEPKYEDIKYLASTEVYSVKTDGIWNLVNAKGEVLQTSTGEEYVHVKGENIVFTLNGKYGIKKLTGEVIVEPIYDKLDYTFSIYYIAKQNDKYGVININNEAVLAFEYSNMYYVEKADIIVADKTETETVILDNNLSQKLSGIVSEINVDRGYIKVYTEGKYKYYNFKFEEKKSTDILISNVLFLSKKDNKYGYVDKSGKVVVEYIYEDATEQNKCGFCAVKKDGVWGSLQKNGAIALEPSVNLDNGIYVDFINKWHLSDDGLYYTK